MEIVGYILDITEVLIIVGLVLWVDRLQKRIEKLESKTEKEA
ncbi:hypothetical protein V3I05_07965 [Helicobacter mastomyrinus]|uniref:Uncharacterized protein n=1 Tax=Helicobacter mastomyrinus TaxID=287948 RepID=A0ABZ3F6B0_9HELI|nr:hypothetical protein [uncultured Helicobacter sp.]